MIIIIMFSTHVTSGVFYFITNYIPTACSVTFLVGVIIHRVYVPYGCVTGPVDQPDAG